MSDFSQQPRQRDFFCDHCNGRIIIPYDLPPTSGPCPHCQATILSPPPPEEPQPQQPQQPQQPVEPVATRSPEPTPIQQPQPQESATEPEQAPPTSAATSQEINLDPTATPKSKSNSLILALIGFLLLLAFAAAAILYVYNKGNNPTGSSAALSDTESQDIMEANYLRSEWKKDAYKTLEAFMNANTVEDKIPYVNNGEALRAKMEDFYGGTMISDSDTPADSFSAIDLTEQDHKRGIFMLSYNQPIQFSLKDFFRPLVTLEVQYKIDEVGLLLGSMAHASNFAMDPVSVQAFFKRTDEGLKLDWEVFAQTKYRLFQSFVEIPDLNHPEIFRVIILEDVPERGQGVQGTRTYRLIDPANSKDSVRVNVKVDSEVGRELSVINWRGNKQASPNSRTATVELEWVGEPENPTLEIKRFICWEFLGLGHEISETTKTAE